MEVDPVQAAGRSEHHGASYYFCSVHCLRTFEATPAKFVDDAAITTEHHCCGGAHEGESGGASAGQPASAARYFCPMCPGVESDRPGDCPKCGMALERNPAWQPATKTIYTCPMHPEIEQDHPGDCPKCGMALEPKMVSAGAEEEDSELRDMTRRFWIGAALALPVFLLAMAHLLPNAPHWVMGEVVALDAVRALDAGRGLGRLAILCARRAVVAHTGISTCSR